MLTFEVQFPYENDTVFIAHCYPYTYSDLLKYTENVVTEDNYDRIRKTTLCQSNAGNDIDILIVTNFESQSMEIAQRKAVILTARVHPGET